MKILVPIDKSRRDGIVLPYTTSTARAFDATITVVHIVPLHRAVVPGAVREAEAYASAVAEGLREQEVDAESIVRRGDPASAIVALVNETRADMIVMTSRVRGNLGKLVLGSVADAVLANCGKPVLLLSDSTPSARVDENVQRQSAYIATVVWNRQVRGLCTADEAQSQLELLATSGLDRDVLFSSYHGLEEVGGTPFDWLDIDFQLQTLRQFLPQEIDPLWEEKDSPLYATVRAEWFGGSKEAA